MLIIILCSKILQKMAALVEAFLAYCDTGVYNDVKIVKPY